MKRRDTQDIIFRNVLQLFPNTVLLIQVAMIGALVYLAWPSITKFGMGFLWKSDWDPVMEQFGALPFIYGTVVTSLIALLLAVPIGLGTGIYLSEYAPEWIRPVVSTLIDLLAAVPSVIYGLWGIFVLLPLMRTHIEPFLGKWLGFLPFFQGPAYGVGFLSAGVILAIMIVPFIISISREVINAVPVQYKEGAYALAATRWEAIRTVVLQAGKTGIIGGIILALGRAIGETMAVTMVIGNNFNISASLFAPGYTLASVIANEFAEAPSKLYMGALMEVGLVLLGVSIIVNMLARIMIWSVTDRQGGRTR